MFDGRPMEYLTLPDGLEVAQVSYGETALLHRRIFNNQCYLQHGIALNPGDVIFDVGANIGMASLFFSQRCPSVTVHAFEPAPVPFAALHENMRTYGIPGSCQQIALADTPGSRDFTYYPQTTLMSGMYADADEDSALTKAFLRNSGLNDAQIAEIVSQKYERESCVTRVSTLSREMAALHVDQIDLLKLDVEKSELHVLHGMAASDWPRLKQLVAEVHDIDERLSEFTALLRTHGFDVAVEQEDGLQGTNVYEVFAVRPR
jgi:31-O-methyltransferase